LLGGTSQFVLGASGHIAGVINPPARHKRSHWIAGTLGDDPEQWLASASSVAGSWWPHWMKWLQSHAGKPVPARTPLGNAQYPATEPAPGRYVKARAA
jgi:polyhydroxyalkanoate synthase